jgi:RNA ligase (TIGR02306 family)
MRKLASVRQVAALTPIEGADNIEVARIDGWNVIVQKGLYEVEDAVVYFEIDSVLPIRDEFEFLRSRCYVASPVEGFRIKTMKMRGVVSQGLVMPYDGTADVGTDLTAELGVVKYDPPLPMAANIKGHWPSFIAKTDQERVQNLPLIPRETYEVTIKLDGTSATVFYNNGEIGICSRNYELKPEGTYWDAAADIVDALTLMGRNLAVQGELMGPGIQKNPLGLSTHAIFVFDVWDIDEQRYLRPDERSVVIGDLDKMIAPSDTLGMIHEVTWYGDFTPAEVYNDEQELRDEILALADLTIGGKVHEGLVFKSYDSNTSFKAINNKYLLKEK